MLHTLLLMKSGNFLITKFKLFLVLIFLTKNLFASFTKNELYYEIEHTFDKNASYELQLTPGYDYSNPYIGIYSLRAGFFKIINSIWSVGIEIEKFGSFKYSKITALENELDMYKLSVKSIPPSKLFATTVRFTPLSGLVNFLGLKILKTDLSLLGGLGVIQYRGLPVSPHIGLGVEVAFGISATFGILTNLYWNIERPGSLLFESRVGVRIGPCFKL